MDYSASNQEPVMFNDKSALDFLINPMPIANFAENVWNSQHFHFSREQPDYFCNLLNGQLSHGWLEYGALPLSRLQLIKGGDYYQIQEILGNSSPVGKNEIFQVLRDGYTIKIDSVSQDSVELGQLIDQLRVSFSADVRDYLVISAPEQPAFDLHYDAEHVIAFQIQGRKKWLVYDYLARNLQNEKVAPLFPPNITDTVFMKPGDSIYMPSSLQHGTVTESGELSISLSIAINALDGNQLLRKVLREAYLWDSFIREPIPLSFFPSASRQQYMEKLKSSFIKRIQDTDLYTELLELEASSVLRGNTSEKLQNSNIGYQVEDTFDHVQRALNFDCHVIPDDKIVRFKFLDHILAFGLIYQEGLIFISRNDQFRAEDIPGLLAPDAKVELVNSLIAIGCLKRIP